MADELMEISENVFRIAPLILGSMQNELPGNAEMVVLDEWMTKSERNRQVVVEVTSASMPLSYLRTYLSYEKNKPAAKTQVMQILFPHNVRSLQTKKWRMRLSVAACILLLVSFYFFYWKPTHYRNNTTLNSLVSDTGRTRSIKLSDGTMVKLNAASSIIYPGTFSGNERRVQIDGEAYFEVAKDVNRPFRVDIVLRPGQAKMGVEVTGTHFNITAYKDESVVKTTLFEGAVVVYNGNKTDTLKPGQQALLTGDTIRINEHPDTAKVTAWVRHYFNFEGDDIKTITRQLARWYNVEFICDKNIPGTSYSGELNRDKTLMEVLQVLKANRISYKIEGKKIILMSE